ncbi:MAG: FAD-binding protein [Acidimicrobiia bacterium]
MSRRCRDGVPGGGRPAWVSRLMDHGHSYPGLSVCDGGMVVDLGLMKGVRVDPRLERVRAQAGVLLGEIDRETQAFGYAVPAGIVTHTGLAGLTLGRGPGAPGLRP